MIKNFFILITLISCGCTSTRIKGFEKKGFMPLTDSTLTHQATNTLIAPYKASLQKKMHKVITYCDTPMKRLKTVPESLLGNFTADLVFEYGKKEKNALDFCVLNFGGLRTSLPKGPITVEKIFELMPFENTLEIVSISKDSLESLLNYLAIKGGQPIANARLEIQDKKPINFSIAKTPIKELPEKKVFHIITSDYLANGGDRMYFFQQPVKRESLGVKLRDVILEHCKASASIGAQLEQRIKIIP